MAVPSTEGGTARPQARGWFEAGRESASAALPAKVAPQTLARALGWFSIGLGVAQLTAPRRLSRLIGIDDGRVMPMMGVREIATGIGILTRPQQPGWLWARVGGDAVDLAFLGGAMLFPENDKRRVAAATAAVLGVTALDVVGAQQLRRDTAGTAAGTAPVRVRVRKSITINASPADCYALWRDFETLPRFMRHLDSVQVLDERRSHWVAKGPAKTRVEWDAEITDDRPNELIAWRTIDAAVPHRGSVRFETAPTGRGTVVRVELEYEPPGGKLGATIARLLGREPGQQVRDDLRLFKQIVELGEIPTTVGQPSGTRGPVTSMIMKVRTTP